MSNIDRYAKFISEQARIARLDEVTNSSGWSVTRIRPLQNYAHDPDFQNEPNSMYAVDLGHADGRTASAHFGVPSSEGGTGSAHRIITHSRELGYFHQGQEHFYPEEGQHMLYGHIDGIEKDHEEVGIGNEFGHTLHRLPDDSENQEVNKVHRIALEALNKHIESQPKPKKKRFGFGLFK